MARHPMPRHLLLVSLLSLAIALGCSGHQFESGDTFIDTADLPDLGFRPTWTKEGLQFDVYNGYGSMNLGMASTDPRAPDPWTGEDCLNGYTTSDGTHLQYCHFISAEGGFLAAGGDPLALYPATQTVFTESDAKTITYAVWDGNFTCWTWGHDPSYYTGAGCQDIN